MRMARFTEFLLALFLVCPAFAGEFDNIAEKALAAGKKKDTAGYSKLSRQAFSIASRNRERIQLCRMDVQFLRKKPALAKKHLHAVLERDDLTEKERRILLNLLGEILTVEKQFDDAFSALDAASFLRAEPGSNEYFRTFELQAHIWIGPRQQPEAAICVMENVLDLKGQLPSNNAKAHMITGKALEAVGKPEEALAHYRKALEYGKKVTYRYSTKHIEKAIRTLEQKLQQTK